jgi:polyphosphate kinase
MAAGLCAAAPATSAQQAGTPATEPAEPLGQAAAEAAAAAQMLRDATGQLDQALTQEDQVASLTQMIQAYERGLAALREGLQQRHYGRAVRIEVSSNCSEEFASLLCRQFELPPQALYRVHGPVNLVRMAMLIDLVKRPDLMFTPFRPVYPLGLQGQPSLFERMRQGDVLVHQPFESFDPVVDLLREAVHDPQVVSIQQTIYRTGSSSVLIDLLSEAFRQGKEVTALVELKARFDEEANINWSEQLEAVGVQVVYGVVGLKTHAKMLLITRREGRRLKRYGHLATGNYNPNTARLYTDLSYFTADDALTGDMQKVFAHLACQSNIPRLSRLLMAPYGLQSAVLRLIQQAGRAAAAGQRGRIVAKMNALTDEALIRALIDAGQKRAQIDLIVRGACMLPAQLTGITGNIRVRSIIGRLLEHSRVFYFDIAGTEHLYLSSASASSTNACWPTCTTRRWPGKCKPMAATSAQARPSMRPAMCNRP